MRFRRKRAEDQENTGGRRAPSEEAVATEKAERGGFLRSAGGRALFIVLICLVLAGGVLLLAFGGAPREGEYVSEYGTRYYASEGELSRLDVPVELSVGESVKTFTVNVVYTYDVYTENFKRRIVMRLDRVEYGGEDQAVKNLVRSLNQDVSVGSAERYVFANLTLLASTDGEYARSGGTVRINGDLLKRK